MCHTPHILPSRIVDPHACQHHVVSIKHLALAVLVLLLTTSQADGTVAEGFEGVGELMPPGLFDNGRPGRGDMAIGWEELSGKLALVARLLAVLRQTCDDK